MKKNIELEQFSGPLDLLLQLIEDSELEITEISLSQVTEQFVSYLEDIEESHPEELADFLVIATRLLLLKSHALIPYLHMEDEEDPGDLEAQLKMYKKYVDAMVGIEALLAQPGSLQPKKVFKSQKISFGPPTHMGAEQMREYFDDVLARLEPVVRIPKAAMQKVVTLREKFVQIHDMLQRQSSLSFKELLIDVDDRAEVVVTFLALLEMVKQQSVYVRQDEPLAHITVKKLDF